MLFLFAYEAAGASRARHSLRPLSLEGLSSHHPGAISVAAMQMRGCLKKESGSSPRDRHARASTRASIVSYNYFAKQMGCRVKPGNDIREPHPPSPAAEPPTGDQEHHAGNGRHNAMLGVHARHASLMAWHETRQLIRRRQEIDRCDDEEDDADQREKEFHELVL
jgi:hypothetical protein